MRKRVNAICFCVAIGIMSVALADVVLYQKSDGDVLTDPEGEPVVLRGEIGLTTSAVLHANYSSTDMNWDNTGIVAADAITNGTENTNVISPQTPIDPFDEADRELLALGLGSWTAFQSGKSDQLKTIENRYVNFLTNHWTAKLHEHGIVPNSFTVTVENTTSDSNVLWLIQLEAINYQDYLNMSGQFGIFESAIKDRGGIMSKVIVHD